MISATDKQYAAALYEAIEDGADITTVVHNLAQLLRRNGHMHRFKNICTAFITYYNKQKNIVTGTITSAHTLDEKTQQHIVNLLKEKAGAADIELVEKIDPQLLAGFIAHVGDTHLDASLRTQLLALKNTLIHAT